MRTMLMLNPMGWSSDISLMGMKEWSDLRHELMYLGADVISPKWKTSRASNFSSEAIIVNNVAVVHEDNAEMVNFLRNHQVEVHTCKDKFSAADVVVSPDKSMMWVAISERTNLDAISFLTDVFKNIQVRPLQLFSMFTAKPEKFSLNQCLSILPNGELVFYADAFCEHSQYVLETWYAKRTYVTQADFMSQACSMVVCGNTILIPQVSNHLVLKLADMGYNVKLQNIDSFVDKMFGCKSLLLDFIE